MRDAARDLAACQGAPFLMIECVAPSKTCIARLKARNERHESDARAELFEEFAAFFEPMTELAPIDHARIDTSLPIEETTKEIERALGGPPGEPHGRTASTGTGE